MAAVAKRVAPTTAATANVAKRAKLEATVVSSQNRVMLQGVAEALDASGLPEDCRRMLQAACPLALGVASDSRHQMQELAVELIGAALGETEAKLVEALTWKETAAEEVLSSRTGVSQKLKDEEDFFEVKEAKAAQRAEELAAAKSKRVICEATLTQRRQGQKTGLATTEGLQAQRRSITEALESFEAVKSQDLSAEELQRHGAVVQEAAQRLPLEETLRQTLPRSCGKTRAERGAFDDMVLEELRKVLDEEAASLDKQLAAEATGVAERAQLVAEAEEKLQESKKVEEACATTAAATEQERVAQAAVVEAARKAVADFDAGAASTMQERDSARAELQNFKTYPMECFSLLRDRQAKAGVEAAGA